MNVRVKTHRSVRPDLVRWVRSLPGPPADRAALARTYYDAMLDVLRTYGGHLPDAVQKAGVYPPTFTCRFIGGWWIRYQVRTERRLFRRRVTVMIVGLFPEPSGRTPP